MEGIEAKQVNDRDILEATVIERQDHSGRIRFTTKLPSGRPLSSEWIQESDKTKAGLLWTEAVRNQIVLDSEEAAAIARRNLKELRSSAKASTSVQPVQPQLLGPNGEAVTASLSDLPVARPSPSRTPVTVVTSSVEANPLVYVQAQHRLARQRLDELNAEHERINLERKEAQKAEAQWFGLLQAMGGGQSEQGQGNSTGGSGGDIRSAAGGDIGCVSYDAEDI